MASSFCPFQYLPADLFLEGEGIIDKTAAH
jgi:hypothetical protein